MKKLILLTAVSTALLSMSSVQAGGGGLFGGKSSSSAGGALYGGASVGKTFNDNCATVEFAEGSDYDNITCERVNETEADDIAWKVFGGYKVAPNFAVEAAYIDFGKHSNIHDDGTTWIQDDSEIKGGSIMGVASYAVTDDFNVFGKLGILRWERESSVIDDPDATADYVATDVGTDLAIGAGAKFTVTDNIAIRGEVEHFDDVDVNLFSLGASFSTL